MTSDSLSKQTAAAGPSREQRPTEPSKLRQTVDNPWAVLAAIFFAMMFLGIPLLWISRGFSLPGKILWTIATLIYSAVIMGLFGLVMWYCYQSIRQALGM